MLLNKEIGAFVKNAREARGMTQAQLAARMCTTQSVIARLERGERNFTSATLNKLSNALHRRIFSLHDSMDFEITGGKRLSGSITVNGSKNGAMGLLCASLLNKGITTLHNIPRIEEVQRIIEVMQSIGVSVTWIDNHSLVIRPPKKLRLSSIDPRAARATRSVLMMIGALIHHSPRFGIPQSGGCKMGERTIAAHRYAFEKMGVQIKSTSNEYIIETKGAHSADIVMYEASDTATENILIAAAALSGTTTIRFAPPNYQVQDVAHFLEGLGAQVKGVTTHQMEITGMGSLANKSFSYSNGEDPIEAMMFIVAALVTRSQLTIKRCPIDFLQVELEKMKRMGAKFRVSETYISENGWMRLVDITVFPSSLTALHDKIHSLPYPGINTDNLPFFVPLAVLAKGTTLIHDWMWENRAIYFTELNKLGAEIVLADPHRVFIHGPSTLRPSQVVCPPALRPAMIVLIAMLATPGTSVLRNVYSIARGYEDVATRLNSLGADIKIIS